MTLTGEQRYRQAVRKARIMAERDTRDFMAGRINICGNFLDRERSFIIAELDRAYQTGLRDAAQTRGGGVE